MENFRFQDKVDHFECNFVPNLLNYTLWDTWQTIILEFDARNG